MRILLFFSKNLKAFGIMMRVFRRNDPSMKSFLVTVACLLKKLG